MIIKYMRYSYYKALPNECEINMKSSFPANNTKSMPSLSQPDGGYMQTQQDQSHLGTPRALHHTLPSVTAACEIQRSQKYKRRADIYAGQVRLTGSTKRFQLIQEDGYSESQCVCAKLNPRQGRRTNAHIL